MKPWNAWVTCIGCAGLCLVLVGCGGSKAPESDLGDLAAQGGVASPPPAPAAAPSQPQPAPAEPAPAPEAVAAATPATTPAPAPSPAAPEPAAAQPKTEEATAKTTESPAITAPAAEATKTAENPAAMPNNATAAAPASEADNPFAVFSEASTTAPAAGRSTTPGAGNAESATAPAPAATPAPEGERSENALGYLNSAGGTDRGSSSGLYHSPETAAMAFLKAVKEKNLAKIAEATALHAPLESKSTANQKLFAAILDQDLAQEDLDEFAKKLDGYQYSGANQAKSSGQLGIIVTKQEGTSLMRRTLTMRHEKAGWKVQDVSGQGEIEKPIAMPRMRGGMGGRR